MENYIASENPDHSGMSHAEATRYISDLTYEEKCKLLAMLQCLGGAETVQQGKKGGLYG